MGFLQAHEARINKSFDKNEENAFQVKGETSTFHNPNSKGHGGIRDKGHGRERGRGHFDGQNGYKMVFNAIIVSNLGM